MLTEFKRVTTQLFMPSQVRHSLALIKMITSYWVTQSLHVVAKLGVADLLKDGPKSSDELAKSVGADARSLYRLLRAVASVGIFSEVKSGHFALTPMGELLQTGVPGSLRAAAIMHGEKWQWQPWGELLESVKNGKSPFKRMFGSTIYDYFSENAEANEIFNSAMTNFSDWENSLILNSYDFSSVHRLIDVGGGQGNLLTSILEANPTMKGILFDLPHVIQSAIGHIEAKGLTARCELISGDYFESVPPYGNTYLLKRIIHGWDDEQAVALLKNCYRAMPDNGKLLLIEMVIPPGNEPFLGKLLDLHILLMRGGHERTSTEYRTLLDAAGFKLTKIIPTRSPLSFIEAVPIPQ